MNTLAQYRNDRISTFGAMMKVKAFTSDAEATAWMKAITGDDKKLQSAALKHARDAINIGTDYLHGTLSNNTIYNAYKKRYEERQKVGFQTGLTHTNPNTTILSVFETFGDELIRDMEWMAVYDMHQVTDSLRAEIVDVLSLVEWEEYEIGERIRTSAYKQDSATFLTGQRFGGGLAFHRLDLRHPMVSLNMAIEALRIKALDEKINQAYTNIQACITAAVTATQITNLDTAGIAHTINLARNTLIQRVADNGFNLSIMQPVELYSHPDHMDIIEAIFRNQWVPTQSDDSASANNPIQVWANTIRRHYTYNLATDLSRADVPNRDAVLLVLPGQDNKWVDFDSLRFDQDNEIKTDSFEIIGQEYYAQQCATAQFQIVDIA